LNLIISYNPISLTNNYTTYWITPSKCIEIHGSV